MKLAEPLKIRGKTMKNRTYMLSMGIPGLVGDIPVNYYSRRAQGGVALMQTGMIGAWPLLLDNYANIRPLTDAVHRTAPDCLIGAQPIPGVGRDGTNWSPSGAPHPATYPSLINPLSSPGPMRQVEFHAMTKDDIKWYIENLATGVKNLLSVGFDVIELHGTHAYLLRQFFSPLDNRREDEYGGSLENRMRFPLENVRAVRDVIGKDVPLWYKMPCEEPEDRGITKDESARLAMELEKAGIDVLIVTQGVSTHARGYMNTVCPIYEYRSYGSFVEYAAFIKRFVSVPIVAVGRINKPWLAESILEEGKADIIGLGRQLIADPDWPQKALTGAWGNIRPCLSCNACIDSTSKYWLGAPKGEPSAPLPCSVNAQSCREVVNKIVPAEKRKKVMVVGSGPAGMEAARVAAERGHQVTLYEKANSLGGALVAAGKGPNKEPLEDLRKYLVMELNRTGVTVKLGQAVTADTASAEKPDAVVVATGARPRSLDIPGARGSNVAIADDVLTGKAKTGSKVMVVGGGLVGLETAQFLAAQGKAVIVVEMLPEIGRDIYPVLRRSVVQTTKEAGVVIYTEAKPEEITGDGVKVNMGGTSHFFKVDSVVLAVGRESDKSLGGQLQGKVSDLHVVGDCVTAGRVRDAIHEGHRVGRTL